MKINHFLSNVRPPACVSGKHRKNRKWFCSEIWGSINPSDKQSGPPLCLEEPWEAVGGQQKHYFLFREENRGAHILLRSLASDDSVFSFNTRFSFVLRLSFELNFNEFPFSFDLVLVNKNEFWGYSCHHFRCLHTPMITGTFLTIAMLA